MDVEFTGGGRDEDEVERVEYGGERTRRQVDKYVLEGGGVRDDKRQQRETASSGISC